MSIVDIKTIKVEHSKYLFFHALSHSFNSQNGENFTNVVRKSSAKNNLEIVVLIKKMNGIIILLLE